MAAFDFMNKVSRQKGVIIMNSIASQVFLELSCKLLDGMKAGTNLLGKTYGWLSSDPEGKQHTNGLIIRQGLNTQLIIKGQRRLKGVFEGSLLHHAFESSVKSMNLGSLMAGTSYFNIRECMSKQVHYNHPKVETVNVNNLRLLLFICLLLLIVSFVVLVVELFRSWPNGHWSLYLDFRITLSVTSVTGNVYCVASASNSFLK